MGNNMDEFARQLKRIKEEELQAQNKATYYMRQLTPEQANIASEVQSAIQPIIHKFVETDDALQLQPRPNDRAYVFHMIYAGTKHLRIAIQVPSTDWVTLNAIVGGSFNLQHLSIYAGPIRLEEIQLAVQDALSKCYRFLVSGHF